MRTAAPIASLALAAAWLLCASTPASAITIDLFVDGVASNGATFASSGDVDTSGAATLTTGSGAVSSSTIESNLGLANKTIEHLFRDFIDKPGYSTGSGPTEGSAFQITFTAQQNDVLSFDWGMTSSEFTRSPQDLDVYTDFAWYQIDGPTGQSSDEGVLARVNDGSFSGGSTGTQPLTFAIARTGTYTVTVGVHDVQDTLFDASAFVNFFRLSRAPEPGTFGTVAMGLCALSWLSRRRRQR